MELSERLKKLRLESGLTQKEVAIQLDMAYQHYQRWEKGGRTPKKDSLEKLAKVFNVSVSYLLGETNIKSSNELYNVVEKLNTTRQEETLNFAKEKLIEQEQEIKIININQPLVPYKALEEVALSAGLGEAYFDCLDTTTVYWNKYVKHDVAIFIRGNSMEPDFEYGQVALINFQNNIDCEGDVYAVDDVSRGVAYIKSVYVEDEYLRLVSLNDDIDFEGNRLFPDIFLPRDENTKIVGKVIEAFTPIEKKF
ncbi:XRE family transcriptional regulator [Lactococcus lactis]|uniref:Pleiotropic regulator of exopolysaccharide synthesis competence and biofilm formation Ftr XRE family n=1 Tax=Lactococcus lactis subsp. lactis TaxID=1360 RepID=A0A0V8E0W3_LACLL|nr:XRE family transcriptional regulator [Lactococcus lactis]KSU19295.1 Pleiotropic regulator of exopolysaccharide synthesis competence and biofilm formation Ftr XRE family [Lactococcus lactis subsp. lactis]